ncbi:MAG: histidine phosphatase family protein [Actinomycetota bacterium]|nr:histidine phosphatase family protein [Actinomycetota bacterium]
MTTVLLARHGETAWNAESRFQGHADPPLNEDGRRQAREFAEQVAGEGIVAIYSSPLRRALETAEIVGNRLGLEVTPVDALREIDVGEWQGLTRSEVEERYPEAFARWIGFGQGWEHGETYEQMGKRVRDALRELAARHPGEVVLVVTHGGPVRTALAEAQGISHEEARRRGAGAPILNCGVSRLVLEDGALRIAA